MTSEPRDLLAEEWKLMQGQFDLYECYSLIIKLISIVLAALSLIFGYTHFVMVLLVCVLWLQDAIWKTFQGRIEVRLLELEAFLSDDEETELALPFQFNTRYSESRPGTVGLLIEYLKQAARPTVAFPYCVLILLVLVL
ncbi:hypothetical protein J3L16_09735 [Alteromonas sp. 5E99-2]|uniref:hypothetical protein n=1 Tax=Alteromonas sp. 5E99-2 TaxID=2817683 RepID=UPI001A9885CB|nr:hypothetical protein [Alteromonas sp. 5E99-2]MBO1255964.1 hypothetical protein [Alteromonas sp. 5E99-2]